MKRPSHEKSRGAPAIEVDAVIDEIAPGGDGVTVVPLGSERRAVFVRGVARGDRVRLAVDTSTRPARGRVVSLLEASADRVPSPCPDAARCGGCDWMHLSEEAQRAAHEAHVRAALPAAWKEIAIATYAAPRALGYRSRARLHVRASGGRAIVGVNEAGTHDPVEVATCIVLDPALEAARVRVAALFEGAHGRGEASLALGALGAGARPAVLDVRWGGALPPAFFARLESAVAEGWLAGGRVMQGESRVPARVGDPSPWMVGADGAPLRLAPGGFAQTSDEGNALLAKRIAAIAEEVARSRGPDARVLELYAGAGNFTVLLARSSTRVIAVEAHRDACEAARANLSARGITHAKVVEADAATYAVPPETHLVVLDPPRTGARDACARVAASSAKHVLYVSCDPQTLARDLALFATDGAARPFVPRTVETFALFPQTSHVETLVHLERAR